MAFNPFNAFRKYRKTMFAILTIICMFVFILSSGLGGKADFLNSIGLGSSNRYPEIARLNGHKIDARELDLVRQRRRIANEYMAGLVIAAGEQLTDRVASRVKDMDPIAKNMIPQMIDSKRKNPGLFPYMMGQYLESLNFIANRLEADKKTEDADLLRKWRRSMQQEAFLLQNQMYFGGSLRTGEDILDFMVWKWVADQHEISLTPEMVQDLVKQETFGTDVEPASIEIEKNLRGRYNVTSSGLKEMLQDEFRVRIAQTVVLGLATQLNNTIPSYVTPHEFYKYYRDVRTAVRVNLMPFSAEGFLSNITDQPSDADLKDLFAKHAKEEADPSLERPGFKEGKKVKIEWIGLKAENPAMRKAAMDAAARESALAEALKKLAASPPAPTLAGVLAQMGAVAIVDDPKLIDKRIDKEYEVYQSKERALSWVYSSLFLFGVHDRSLYQPQVIASAVADMLAGRGTGAPALTPSVTWGTRAVVQELRERIRFGMLPFAIAGQGLPQMLGVTDLMVPQPLSRAAMSETLREEVSAAVVKDYLRAETAKFQEEVAKKGKDIKKPEVKQELAKYVDEFVKKYALSRGGSAEFDDRFHMIDDPGLKPLRGAYLKSDRNKADAKGLHFGTSFFDESGNDFSAGSPYRVIWFDGNDPTFAVSTKPDEEYFLVWKNEEIPAKVRTFAEARPDVEKAWRLAKARDLAKKSAEDMEKQVREKALKNLAALKDFAAQNKVDLIEVGPIAKINEHPSFDPRQPTQYMGPTVPAEKVAYPTADFGAKLVDLRDKPIGETVLLHDAPRNHYYVGVLTDRQEPSELSFELIYKRSGGDGMSGGDPLLPTFESEQRIKLYRETLEQLRSDAKLTITSADELKRRDERGNGGGEDTGE